MVYAVMVPECACAAKARGLQWPRGPRPLQAALAPCMNSLRPNSAVKRTWSDHVVKLGIAGTGSPVLRIVAVVQPCLPRAWNGSWNGAPD